MKTPIALAVIPLLCVASLAAQSRPAPKPPPAPPPMTAPPPPPMPSAPASLTVPNPFGGLIPGPRDLYQSPDGSDRFQQLRPQPGPRPPWGGGVGGGYYGGGYWPYYPDPYAPQSVDTYRPVPAEINGGLVLDSSPASAQGFVDGFYVGLVEEFGPNGRPMSLPVGARRVELRAPGYETLSFSVMIQQNDIVRYRGDMIRIGAAAPVVITPGAKPAAAKAYYVIPKCYAGDKPPTGPLPAGCDRKNLQTYK